jgi:Na+-translocating ferredoxin:NAD+ oxidoreductase RNF subunit RnfB
MTPEELQQLPAGAIIKALSRHFLVIGHDTKTSCPICIALGQEPISKLSREALGEFLMDLKDSIIFKRIA